jgi:hypothetical protein
MWMCACVYVYELTPTPIRQKSSNEPASPPGHERGRGAMLGV